MESGVLDGSFSDTQKNNISYSETLNKHFPYYLSIGMSESQYWDCDCELVKYYREAEELKNENLNRIAWLQAMYQYDVLCRVAPIYNPYAKAGTKPVSFMEKPYPITKKEQKKDKEDREKAEYLKGIAIMNALMNNSKERK